MVSHPRIHCPHLGAKGVARILLGVGCILLLLGCGQWEAPVSGNANADGARQVGEAAGLPAGDEPVVRSTDPADLGRNVKAYQDIQVVWSKPMDQEATAQALIIQPVVPVEISWQDQGRLMIIHPQSPGFQPSPGCALYKITLTTGAMSEDGLHMREDYSYSFCSLACNG